MLMVDIDDKDVGACYTEYIPYNTCMEQMYY
jgi:hypothetical protein